MHALRDGEQEPTGPQGSQSQSTPRNELDPGNQAALEQVQAPAEELSFLQAAEDEVLAIPASPLTMPTVRSGLCGHRPLARGWDLLAGSQNPPAPRCPRPLRSQAARSPTR
jgi:hypothetical protein